MTLNCSRLMPNSLSARSTKFAISWAVHPTSTAALSRIGKSDVVAADAKLTQGRRLKIDPPRRGVLRSGGPHAGGGGSGGDPGLETARQEHSRDRAAARGVTQYGAPLSAGGRKAAVRAGSATEQARCVQALPR